MFKSLDMHIKKSDQYVCFYLSVLSLRTFNNNKTKNKKHKQKTPRKICVNIDILVTIINHSMAVDQTLSMY